MGNVEVIQIHHYWDEEDEDAHSFVATHQNVPFVSGFGTSEEHARSVLCDKLAARCVELDQRIHRDIAIVRSAREILRRIDVLPALPEHKTTPNGTPAAKDRA